MFINISDVLTSENKVYSTEFDNEMTDFSPDGNCYQVLKSSKVLFEAENLEEGKALIKVQCDFSFRLSCDRCLTDVDTDIPLSFERVVYGPERSDEFGDEDAHYMDGYKVDVNELLSDELVMNWPTKVLCREDCKGLCPKCGHDLNTGMCTCDTFIPDPRMAAIKDIFNANKEV